MEAILNSVEWTYMLRILVSCICGSLIGFEREKRSKNAGIRTHILVSLASSLMMIVSKYGFYDVIITEGITIDASRIAAGVVTAIGFLGAGVIFIRNENTIGLTTAAGLWGTVGIGITIGAGMYITGIASTILVIVLQYLLHAKIFHAGTQLSGKVKITLEDKNISIKDIYTLLKKKGFGIKSITIEEEKDSSTLIAFLIFKGRESLEEEIESLKEVGKLSYLEVVSAP